MQTGGIRWKGVLDMFAQRVSDMDTDIHQSWSRGVTRDVSREVTELSPTIDGGKRSSAEFKYPHERFTSGFWTQQPIIAPIIH